MFESKTDDSGTLACNTEKDKEKLHYRTAGGFLRIIFVDLMIIVVSFQGF